EVLARGAGKPESSSRAVAAMGSPEASAAHTGACCQTGPPVPAHAAGTGRRPRTGGDRPGNSANGHLSPTRVLSIHDPIAYARNGHPPRDHQGSHSCPILTSVKSCHSLASGIKTAGKPRVLTALWQMTVSC